MKAFDLNRIGELFFSTADIANVLGISPVSARVSASRYVRKKILVRLKRDVYIRADRMAYLTDGERFRLANIIQTPSYISLTTALSYYGISTQQMQNYVESVALKRTKRVVVNNLSFSYHLIKQEIYDRFELRDGFFIAVPEKAVTDAIYLTSLGRYNCDFYAVDFTKVDKEKVDSYLKHTNRISESFWERLCENFKI